MQGVAGALLPGPVIQPCRHSPTARRVLPSANTRQLQRITVSIETSLRAKDTTTPEAGGAALPEGGSTSPEGVGARSSEGGGAPQAVTKPILPWWSRWQASNRRVRQQLQSYGVSGLIAYGLCNTVYYTCAFLFIWVWVVRVPLGLGWSGVLTRFAEVMSITWAYSQVTKLARAGAALALAPFVDGSLLFVQCRVGLRSRAATAWMFAGVMLTVAAVIFGSILAVWS